MQERCRLADHCERHPRALRNGEQRVLTTGKIQHPKASVDLYSDGLTAGGSIKASFAVLRFTIRPEIAISPVIFQHIDDGGANAKRLA